MESSSRVALQFSLESKEQESLGTNPSYSSLYLCDLGQVTWLLRAAVLKSSARGVVTSARYSLWGLRDRRCSACTQQVFN